MYASRQGTMAHHKSRPLRVALDLSEVKMSHIAQEASKVKGMKNTDGEAILYYLCDHIFHLLESKYGLDEPLPEEANALAEKVTKFQSQICLRMLYYMAVICPEEVAFCDPRGERLFEYAEDQVGEGAGNFLKRVIKREGRSSGWLTVDKDLTFGKYAHACQLAFQFGKWSSGFGGFAWADIAKCLREAVRGQNSLALMTDKALSLSHNNGSIFNKGHYYDCYSPHFYEILDIQASGQIPAMVLHKPVSSVTPEIKALAQEALELFPDELAVKFDSSKVKSMEAVRRKKEEAQKKKWHSAHAHHGAAGGANPMDEDEGKKPPKRACDDIFSADELASHLGVKGIKF